jgi:ubiquinone/menaquinone biosynthesis C-methylase UbiE
MMSTNKVTTKDVKPYKGMAMEGPVASWYTKNTAKDMNRHQGMAARMSKLLSPGDRVLEVAPGPGFFCIELARLGNYTPTSTSIFSKAMPPTCRLPITRST